MPRPRTNKSSADRRTKKQLLAIIDAGDRVIAALSTERDDAMRKLAQETTARIDAERERDNYNEQCRRRIDELALMRKARDWNIEKLGEVKAQHAHEMAALKRRLADAERECSEAEKPKQMRESLRQTREALAETVELSDKRFRAWQRASADLAQLRSVVTGLADAMRAAASENGAA